MFDTNEALWGGFVIKAADQRQIFFAGDTGYGSHFKLIREKLGPMDISILPIGAYEPRWFMKVMHQNPEEAVQAHLDLESKFSIGTHFGAFQLTDEGVDEPVSALRVALEKLRVNPALFIAPDIGETTFMPALISKQSK
jgi:L-ascorbate metabolism protein UlaG (beta-lactamase superfamily)